MLWARTFGMRTAAAQHQHRRQVVGSINRIGKLVAQFMHGPFILIATGWCWNVSWFIFMSCDVMILLLNRCSIITFSACYAFAWLLLSAVAFFGTQLGAIYIVESCSKPKCILAVWQHLANWLFQNFLKVNQYDLG